MRRSERFSAREDSEDERPARGAHKWREMAWHVCCYGAFFKRGSGTTGARDLARDAPRKQNKRPPQCSPVLASPHNMRPVARCPAQVWQPSDAALPPPLLRPHLALALTAVERAPSNDLPPREEHREIARTVQQIAKKQEANSLEKHFPRLWRLRSTSEFQRQS